MITQDRSQNTQQILHKLAKFTFGHIQALLGLRPRGICLVTGCPRSGTSALLHWLHEQKQVTGLNESRILISAHRFVDEVERLEALFDKRLLLLTLIRRLLYTYYARSRYVVGKLAIEKEPLEPMAFPDKGYERFLRNIRLIFPEIKLLFIIRGPVETIWSMRQRQWGYSLTDKKLRTYSLEECIRNWQACAELIAKYASAQNVYVCKFERLVANPVAESRRILDFLSIRATTMFQPRATSVCGFSETDQEFIVRETEPQREMLADKIPDDDVS